MLSIKSEICEEIKFFFHRNEITTCHFRKRKEDYFFNHMKLILHDFSSAKKSREVIIYCNFPISCIAYIS